METSRNSFVYQPFRGDEEIRLLELLPSANVSATIKCRILHVTLAHDIMFKKEEQPKYEALSYVWGDPFDTTPIQLQGASVSHQAFLVTKNLESALRHLRNHAEPRALWVDAICIDQSNHEERAQQVTIMSRIYRRAVRDLLWLGTENDASNKAFDLLELYQNTSDGSWQSGERSRSKKKGMEQLYYRRMWGDREFGAPRSDESNSETTIANISDEMWQFFQETFNQRAVWHRVWILQEIVNARDVLIVCGHRVVPWSVLGEFLDACMQFSTNYDRRLIESHIIDTIDRAYYIHFYREAEKDPLTSITRRNTIISTWRSFSSWTSTDPRDRLFALSGLNSNMRTSFPVPEPLIKPNYDISARDLFCAAVRSDISSSQRLDALCLGHAIEDRDPQTDSPRQGGARSPTNKVDGLPSWVPDFAGSGMLANPHIYRYRRDRYQASGETKAPSVQVPESSEQGVKDRLVLTGIYLDSITRMNPNVTRERRKFEDLQALVRTVEAVQEHHIKSWAAMGQTVSFAYKDHGSSTGLDGIENWLIARPKSQRPDMHTVAGGSSTVVERTDVSNYDSQYDPNLGSDFPSTMVCLAGYVFCTTTKGLKCMVPEHSRPGNTICILYGSPVPHVLRAASDFTPSGHNPDESRATFSYRLIGTAYVHNFMHGEALTERDRGLLGEKEFVLV